MGPSGGADVDLGKGEGQPGVTAEVDAAQAATFLSGWIERYRAAQNLQPWFDLFEDAWSVLPNEGESATESTGMHSVSIGDEGDLPFYLKRNNNEVEYGVLALWGGLPGGDDVLLAKILRNSERLVVETFNKLGDGDVAQEILLPGSDKHDRTNMALLFTIYSSVVEAEKAERAITAQASEGQVVNNATGNETTPE